MRQHRGLTQQRAGIILLAPVAIIAANPSGTVTASEITFSCARSSGIVCVGKLQTATAIEDILSFCVQSVFYPLSRRQTRDIDGVCRTDRSDRSYSVIPGMYQKSPKRIERIDQIDQIGQTDKKAYTKCYI